MLKKGKYFPNIPSHLRALASTYYQRKFLLLLTAYTLLTVGTYHLHDILFFMFKCRLFDRSNVWLVYYKQWSTTGKLFLSYSWKFTGQSTGIWISVWQNITATLLILLLLIQSSTHMCPLLLSLKTCIMELHWFCSKKENISRIKTFGVKQIGHLVKLNFLLIMNELFVFKLLGSL